MTTSAQSIGRAIGALQLRDIMLLEARFSRPVREPDLVVGEQDQLVKKEVSFTIGDVHDGTTLCKILQVVIGLGIRVCVKGDHEKILLEIEADFVAEYQVKADIDDEAIKLFADYNSVHNVWPFWRQHVYDIAQRGRLPKIEVPLFGPTQFELAQRENDPSGEPVRGAPTEMM